MAMLRLGVPFKPNVGAKHYRSTIDGKPLYHLPTSTFVFETPAAVSQTQPHSSTTSEKKRWSFNFASHEHGDGTVKQLQTKNDNNRGSRSAELITHETGVKASSSNSINMPRLEDNTKAEKEVFRSAHSG